MLATPLVLFESPFSRVMLDHLPFLVFTGTGFPQRILDAIVISMAMAAVFALAMYLRDRKTGVPFLVAAGLIVVPRQHRPTPLLQSRARLLPRGRRTGAWRAAART